VRRVSVIAAAHVQSAGLSNAIGSLRPLRAGTPKSADAVPLERDSGDKGSLFKTTLVSNHIQRST
jgi:hypothetical protein